MFHFLCATTNYGIYRFLFTYRWSQHVLWTFKHIRTYRYVLILLALSTWPKIPEIFVVEEVHHCPSNGKLAFVFHDSFVFFFRGFVIEKMIASHVDQYIVMCSLLSFVSINIIIIIVNYLSFLSLPFGRTMQHKIFKCSFACNF